MRYETEYNPAITETCKTYISNNINPVYQNEDTSIYALDYVYEELSQLVNDNDNETILGVSFADIEALDKLMNELVDYIEF